MKRALSLGRTGASENGEPQRRRSVQWDEANLVENDKIKAELNPGKIDEPKTPYHGPLDSDEEPSLGEAGMAPLTLEDDAAIEHLSDTRQQEEASGGGGEGDLPTAHTGWSDSERGEMSSGAPSNSQSSGGGGGDEASSGPRSHRHREKRRRFEALRRQHYNMRDALRRGKALLSEEPEPTGATSPRRAAKGLPNGVAKAEKGEP